MAAPTPPKFTDFLPSGVSAQAWSDLGVGRIRPGTNPGDYDKFVNSARNAGTQANKVSGLFGGADKYISANTAYEKAYAKYVSDMADYNASQGASDEIVESQKNRADTVLANAGQLESVVQQDKDTSKQIQANIRQQLESQYNNLVKFDSRLAYQGRSGDLSKVFDQQAAQLRSAGVTDISTLRNQDGRLVDMSTGNLVSTSNLGGQITTDRDTGVQKWGDIFSGVKGGANYGIAFASDGSPIFFPAWEKTKSPIAQIGLGGLESVIVPLLTIGGAMIGVPGLGAVGGAAAGAAVGNTTGQLLASGEVDWEQVALSAASAGAGQYVGGLLGGEAAAVGEAGGSGISVGAGGETGLLAGSGGVTGIVPPAGFELAPNLGASIGAGVSMPSQIDLLGGTDFSQIGETGISGAPSTSGSVYDPFATAAPGVGEGIIVLPPSVPGGAATVAGLEAPGLSGMGGAQGITVPIQGGGVVSEMGFVPPGATPSLGDPESFINNPDYLGSPVISEDYLATTAADMPSGIDIQDALDLAKTGANLLGGQQQQQGGLLGGGQVSSGGRRVSGVDYSGLLSLLQGQTRTPGIASLLTPVVRPVANPYQALLSPQPQYQPLSLLG